MRRYLIANEEVTIEDIMRREGMSQEEVERLLEFMVRNGSAKVVEEVKTPWEEIMNETRENMQNSNEVAFLDQEQDEAQQFKRIKDAEGQLVREVVKVKYTSSLKIKEDVAYFKKKGLISGEAEIYKVDGEGYILVLRNISEKEYSLICNKVKIDDLVESTTGFINTAITGTAEAVDFAARNVIAPATKIASTAVAKTGKTVGTTAIKAGASLINGTSQAIKEGAEELSTNEEMIRAKKNLADGFSGLKNMFGFKKKPGRVM